MIIFYFYFTGRQFDINGNLNQWWNTSIITKFKEKTQCFIDQYSQFVVPEAGLNVRISLYTIFMGKKICLHRN